MNHSRHGPVPFTLQGVDGVLLVLPQPGPSSPQGADQVLPKTLSPLPLKMMTMFYTKPQPPLERLKGRQGNGGQN